MYIGRYPVPFVPRCLTLYYLYTGIAGRRSKTRLFDFALLLGEEGREKVKKMKVERERKKRSMKRRERECIKFNRNKRKGLTC